MTPDTVPRLRMFAGPNGSGKTTVKTALGKPATWFGAYINPDDIEAAARRDGRLSLDPLGLAVTAADVSAAFAASPLLAGAGLSPGDITDQGCTLGFGGTAFTAYHASVLSDLLRRTALDAGRSFSFETVMSFPDKVALLAEARRRGFRTYLYYIATEDPEINVQRVRNRVADGGHGVPEPKIVERYHRSLGQLAAAIRHADRAYLFDTSEAEAWYLAEVTDGTAIDLKSDGEVPNWFAPVWAALQPAISPPGTTDQ